MTIPTVQRAHYYATLQHGSQSYNDEVPYVVHLGAVVDVLQRFQIDDPEMICAAWLHDAIEDTRTSYNDIKQRFGDNVAELVYAVTSELGRNRGERNAKTYPKIAGNARATALKLADRIANVEYGLATGSDMVARYKKEHEGFRAVLYKPGYMSDGLTLQVEFMWNHLDQLLA